MCGLRAVRWRAMELRLTRMRQARQAQGKNLSGGDVGARAGVVARFLSRTRDANSHLRPRDALKSSCGHSMSLSVR
jgi:hypothetical protein